MKFTAQEDISAPIAQVYAQVCDPDRLERTVRQRGGKIQRAPMGPFKRGTRWDAEVAFRGATRQVSFVLHELNAPHVLRLRGGGAAFDITVDVELVALSPATTRLSVITEGRPKTLAARVMMQSLKLAQGRMLTRYRQRISEYATDIEKDNRLS
jgi:carbon monoxide dehydrogenase subunit G